MADGASAPGEELTAGEVETLPELGPATLPELPPAVATLPELPPEVATLPELPPEVVVPPRSFPRRVEDALGATWTFVTGSVGLLAGLSVLAAIPVLQLATLGWLLEAEGRIGRTGKLRGSLPGVAQASRMGAAILGLLLLLLPLVILDGYRRDAALLDATSRASRGLVRATEVVLVLTIAQAAVALAQGGRFLDFFRPLKGALFVVRRARGGPILRPAWTAIVDLARELDPLHYVGLGAQGLVAGFLWLGLPTALIAIAGTNPGLALLGALLLALVIPWVATAQARLAAEQRFGAAFELREIRRRIARAPIFWAVAVVLVLGLALPLYLLKIEPLPRDARWLPAVFFLALLIPGRIASGLAYAKGAREGRSHPVLRLIGAAVALPSAAFYVFILFFSQFFNWYGSVGLQAHHAFLLPVAFA